MAKVVTVEKPTANRMAWLGMLFRGLLIAAAGGFIIFYTDNFIRLLTVAIGAWMVVSGVMTLVGAFRIKNDKRRRNYSLLRSGLNIIIGAIAVAMLFLVTQANWVILLYVVAIQLVIGAVLETMIGFRLRSAGLAASGAFVAAFISFAIAVVLFLAPELLDREILGQALVTVIGGVILSLGIALMAYSLGSRKR